jgi:hypothetical protein
VEAVRELDQDRDDEATIDSTWMETMPAHAHVKTRSRRTGAKCEKLPVRVIVGSLVPASVVASWSPSNDKREPPDPLVKSSVTQHKRSFTDATYAEWVHEFCRETWPVESIVKLVVHCADSSYTGSYRLQKTKASSLLKYGRAKLLLSRLHRFSREMQRGRSLALPFDECFNRLLRFRTKRCGRRWMLESFT